MDINSQFNNIKLTNVNMNTKTEEKTIAKEEANPSCAAENVTLGSDKDVLNSLEMLSQYNKATVKDPDNKEGTVKINEMIKWLKYCAEDMVDNDEVKVTRSKRQGVVAIQIQGDPNTFNYPSTSTPNKEILVKDANGYPVGKLHYDENGKLTQLESLVDSVRGFETGKTTLKLSDYVSDDAEMMVIDEDGNEYMEVGGTRDKEKGTAGSVNLEMDTFLSAISEEFESVAYSAEDMVDNDEVKVTRSKREGVVAIQIQGDANDFVYPSTSTPNKEILVQDKNGYPVGKLHYDENGELEDFEPLVDDVMSFDEAIEEEYPIEEEDIEEEAQVEEEDNANVKPPVEDSDKPIKNGVEIAETGKPFVDKIGQATYYIKQLLPNVKTARAKAASMGGPMQLAEHYRKNLKKYHKISLTSFDIWNIMQHLFGNPSKKAIK